MTAILAKARTLRDEAGKILHLAYESDATRLAPEVSASLVRFNGAGEKGHETFLFTRVGAPFHFCKTAQKPYDAVVCAVLLAAKHHLGAALTLSSDGTWAEWKPGRDLYFQATGRQATQPWKET